MNKSEFDKLLERYVTGQVSDQERIKIEAWLEVMKAEEISELDFSKSDEDRLFKKISANTVNVQEVIEFRPGVTRIHVAWKAAAGILLIVGLSLAGWQVSTRYLSSSANSVLAVKKVILTDGSIAWLRGNSKIAYSEKAGIRHAEFEGEALFEVAKDAEHPFLIHWNGTTIKVLGTSFNLRASRDTLELKVLTGRVNFSAEKAGVDIDVLPNQKVLFHHSAQPVRNDMVAAETAALVVNPEYNMQFANTTLGEVALRLGKKFNVTIELDQQKIGGCKITADLTDRSLATSLEMLSEILDVRYEQKENAITLTGTGCNSLNP